jgi:hypothetical protein
MSKIKNPGLLECGSYDTPRILVTTLRRKAGIFKDYMVTLALFRAIPQGSY